MRRHLSRERGAAAVETALLVSLVLVPLLVGSVEFGFGFNEWLSVKAATREGARVGASAGDLVSGPGVPKDADCLSLEATAGALQAVPGDAVTEVWIFESDTSGSVGNKNRFRPSVDTDDPGALFCGTWVQIENGWPIAGRVNTGVNRDYLGLRVMFDHSWVTGLPPFVGMVQWREDTIMRVEPAPGFSP